MIVNVAFVYINVYMILDVFCEKSLFYVFCFFEVGFVLFQVCISWVLLRHTLSHRADEGEMSKCKRAADLLKFSCCLLGWPLTYLIFSVVLDELWWIEIKILTSLSASLFADYYAFSSPLCTYTRGCLLWLL